MLNILFILPEYYPHSGGGISTYYINYITSLQSTVNKIKVIVGSGYTNSNENYNLNGIEIEYLKPELFKKYLEKFKKFDIYPEYQKNIASSWAMYEQAQSNFDFHIVETTDFGLGYVPWTFHRKTPLIVRLHGSHGQIDLFESNLKFSLGGDLYRFTELSLLPLADALITLSKNNQVFFENILPNSKIHFFEATFPINQKDNPPVNINNKSNFAMICGRVQMWKGPEILCQALQISEKKLSNILWVGKDTEYDNNLSNGQYLQNKYPLIWGNQIKHIPAQDQAQLKKLQMQSKFGIVPSSWDVFNFTCIEYLTLGIPVICSENAGCSYLIEHGVNGFIFKNNSPQELSDCLILASQLTDELYIEMSKQAKNTVSQNLSIESTIPPNYDLYKTITKKEVAKNNFLERTFFPSNYNASIPQIANGIPIKSLLYFLSFKIYKKLKSCLP